MELFLLGCSIGKLFNLTRIQDRETLGMQKACVATLPTIVFGGELDITVESWITSFPIAFNLQFDKLTVDEGQKFVGLLTYSDKACGRQVCIGVSSCFARGPKKCSN